MSSSVNFRVYTTWSEVSPHPIPTSPGSTSLLPPHRCWVGDPGQAVPKGHSGRAEIQVSPTVDGACPSGAATTASGQVNPNSGCWKEWRIHRARALFQGSQGEVFFPGLGLVRIGIDIERAVLSEPQASFCGLQLCPSPGTRESEVHRGWQELP